MLSKKRGLQLFRWISVVTLTAVPLVSAVHADNAGPAATSKTEKKALGLKVAVVATSDSSGNQDAALRALQAANIGLERQPGYIVENPQAVAKALKEAHLQWPFAPKQYPEVRKKLDKADRVLTISVSPQPGASATYNAVAELYDATTGGLVGRGESLYTVSSSAPDANNADPQMRAVDGAVLGAIADMSKPAVLNGVVISLPESYRVRISLGSFAGLRNGSRLEYMADGKPFAYGTVIDLGTGESVATVAPESAFGKIQVNTPFRTAAIPPIGLAGLSRQEISKEEFDKSAKDFAIAGALATIVYLIAG
jgi:hypothetical protein